MSRLVSLYPSAWRTRYQDEFAEVLASRPQSIRERVDILRGAVDAHRHPQVAGPDRVPDRYGLAPLLGLACLVGAVLLAANGPVQLDEYGSYRDGAAALPFFVLAFVLLSVGLYRLVDRLPADAASSRLAGWVAIVAGPTWAIAPWLLPIGVVFILGTLGLTVGARRAGILPAWSEVLLVPVLAVPAGLFVALYLVPWYVGRASGLNLLVLVAPMSCLWLVVGGLLLRGYARPNPR